jgi:hypothetical protein
MAKKVQSWESNNCINNNEGRFPAKVNHAGQLCWLLAGTLCDDEDLGVFAQKLSNCNECDFYKNIKKSYFSMSSWTEATEVHCGPEQDSGMTKPRRFHH